MPLHDRYGPNGELISREGAETPEEQRAGAAAAGLVGARRQLRNALTANGNDRAIIATATATQLRSIVDNMLTREAGVLLALRRLLLVGAFDGDDGQE